MGIVPLRRKPGLWTQDSHLRLPAFLGNRRDNLIFIIMLPIPVVGFQIHPYKFTCFFSLFFSLLSAHHNKCTLNPLYLFQPLTLPPPLWQSPVCSSSLFCLFLSFIFWLFDCSLVLFLKIPHMSEIIQHLFLSVWLISLSIISSRSTHVFANVKSSFFFMVE